MGRSNERSLGEIIKEVLRHHRLEGKITETRIMSSWENVMGSNIARYTEKITLRGSKLIVTLRSSVLRSELSYSREKIIQNINRELGENAINDVVFL